jgi:hypothetical protein
LKPAGRLISLAVCRRDGPQVLGQWHNWSVERRHPRACVPTGIGAGAGGGARVARRVSRGACSAAALLRGGGESGGGHSARGGRGRVARVCGGAEHCRGGGVGPFTRCLLRLAPSELSSSASVVTAGPRPCFGTPPAAANGSAAPLTLSLAHAHRCGRIRPPVRCWLPCSGRAHAWKRRWTRFNSRHSHAGGLRRRVTEREREASQRAESWVRTVSHPEFAALGCVGSRLR